MGVKSEIVDNCVLFLPLIRLLQQSQDELKQLSCYDNLTHLANRAQFDEILKREFSRIVRFNRKMALLYIDIDFFKKMNDSLGREAGDLLLKEVAERLQTALRTEDFLARTGGDEFAAILTEVSNPHDAGIVAHRIVDAMKTPFKIEDRSLMLGVSVGIACYPDAGQDIVSLSKNANIALASAKGVGRGNYQFFTMDLHTKHSQRLEIEAELHFALERNEFFLEFQPRFNMATQKMVGMEVLLRWMHPLHGVIAPNDFISIAEETGLIVPIGRWVLQAACKQYATWRKKYSNFKPILAVNVSPLQFQHNSFVNWVVQAMTENDIAPNLMELEITETAAVGFMGKFESNVFQLRHVGVQFSIDDFGRGSSSLSHLKNLPIQSIKIDKSFVSEIDVSKTDNMIIKSSLVLAKGMGLNVIAEGVETEAQLKFLEKNDCPEAQGFFYSKPLSVEEMEDFIKMYMSESIV